VFERLFLSTERIPPVSLDITACLMFYAVQKELGAEEGQGQQCEHEREDEQAGEASH
jgi:hypothetical protein